MKKCILIGLSLWIQCASSIEPVSTAIAAYESVKWAKDAWNNIQNGWNWIKDMVGFGDKESEMNEYNDQTYLSLSGDIKKLAAHLDEIKKNHEERHTNIEKLVLESARMEQIDDSTRALNDKLTAVQLEFKELRKILPKESKNLPVAELCTYASGRLVGNDLSLKISAIFAEVTMSEGLLKPDLWDLLRAVLLESADTACGKGHSPYEYLHAFYNRIIITEMEGYMALLFSHYFLYNYNGTKGCDYFLSADPKTAVGKIYDDFETRVQKYSELFVEKMQGLRMDFRECSGGSLERGVTFHELESAVQTVSMLPDGNQVTGCTDIAKTMYKKSTFCTSNNECYSLPRTCLGLIAYCTQDAQIVNFCMDNEYSSRRYKWFNRASEDSAKSNCPGKMYRVKPELTPSCLCSCYDNHPTSRSTHLFNLQAVEADIENNMILTGIRFVVKHRVMQIQIQQGKLLNHWRIENPEWKPINDIAQEIFASRVNKSFRGQSPGLKEFVDYYVVSHPPTLALNNVQAPAGNIVTGAKFHWDSEQQYLQLAIISRPFSHTSGHVDTANGPKISYGPQVSKKLTVDRTNPLTFNPTPSAPQNDGCIEFRESDWDSDSGQTTVPLFDAIPLVSSPPSPLGGIGIFLKTAPKSAGLISFQFFSMDYVNYLENSVIHLKEHIMEERKRLANV